MTEVENVAVFLSGSVKGRLQYDRDWASSREGVDRVLQQLSSEVLQMNLSDAPQGNDRKEEEAAQGIHCESTVPKILERIPSASSSSGKKLDRLDTLTPQRTRLLGDLDVSMRSTGSPANRSLLGKDSPDPLLHNYSAANRSLLNLSGAEIGSPNITTPKRVDDSYFGVRPLRVTVNRTAERSLDKSSSFLDSESYSSPVVGNIDEQCDAQSLNKVRTSDSSVFHYSPGFLQRLSTSTVSVDVIKLKLESVRHLLSMEEEEEQVEDKESDEEDLDSEVQADLEYERRLAVLREELRTEADKKTLKVQQLFKEKSLELASQAETRHQQEMEHHHRQIREEEQRVIDQVKREKEANDAEEAESEAAEVRRLAQMELFLQSCRDQENKIKEEAEREIRIKEQKERLDATIPVIKENIVALLELWEGVQDKSKLSQTSVGYNEFTEAIDSIKKLVHNGNATEEDWMSLENLNSKIQNSILAIEEDLVSIEKAAKEAKKAELEAARAAEVEAAKALKAAQLQQQQSQEALQKQQQQQQQQQQLLQKQEQHVEAPQLIGGGTDQPLTIITYPTYQEILTFKSEYVKDVSFADSEKKVKSELTLAISTSLNAISALTTEHLNDKLAKLTLLLAGRPVAMKESQICAANHPSGIKFCMGMLAKKIVRQGEDVMSSRVEAAFSFASVALSLWDTFPDFGKLLLAYFYEFCPLLAPHVPPRVEGQTEKEFYTSLGYKYDKDSIEKQDKYLKRMTGLSRLFAAIAASHKPSGSNPDHPMGPKVVWHYLTSLMNLEPLPDVTATMLLVMLEITGNMMMTQYKDQFYKLLVFIKQSFLPVLESIKTDGGPTVRLDTFLQKVLAEKKIDAPKGILSPGFVHKVQF